MENNILYKAQDAVMSILGEIGIENIPQRIAERDHSVWKPEPTEISNRLGWLDSAHSLLKEADELAAFAAGVQSEGYTDVVLLGMGGSSMAPELFGLIFDGDGLRISIVDGTTPSAIQATRDALDLSKTVFVVASKSGGTVETLSFFKYFYGEVIEELGRDQAPAHFIAITDPGSKLLKLGEALNFRRVFINDPNIGGRYSALSYFGIVPAALIGVDIKLLLERAVEMATYCDPSLPPAKNPAFLTATLIAVMASTGRDKLTFIAPQKLEPFGNWLEQLIAESLGKESKGILPVVGESVGDPAVYSDDRQFVSFELAGDDSTAAATEKLEAAGHPVIRLKLEDIYDLGSEFYRWMLVTAVLGYHMQINPFDQPNVESAKIQARKVVAEYAETGSLPQPKPVLKDGELAVYDGIGGKTAEEALRLFVDSAKSDDYFALQAYLPPTVETTAQLQALRHAIRDGGKIATTLGYGPRFLHSTGQLHKGDGGNGLFIIFSNHSQTDIGIVDEPGGEAAALSFGVLVRAQLLGDMQALRDNGRRVLRIDLGRDVAGGLQNMLEALSG